MCENLAGNCCLCEIYKQIIRLPHSETCYKFVHKNPKISEEIVQKWSEEHQITTNEDKIKEIFGEICYILEGINSPFIEKSDIMRDLTEWLNQEYKGPQRRVIDP